MSEPRPANDAERFLRLAQRAERGRLTVYLGAAPGVGKTYRMLQEAARRQAEGVDVVVGIAESHGRSETAQLIAPFEVLPRKAIVHAGHRLEEFDIDGALQRRPGLILVDELAHTNAPGSRHPKRWQDVAELVVAGIDVATTLNIQHIESLNDIVAGFTHVRVRETVPDSILESAEVILVDLPPEALIERLKSGRVYLPETAGQALSNFFTPVKLGGLRELALRYAAGSVDRRLASTISPNVAPSVRRMRLSTVSILRGRRGGGGVSTIMGALVFFAARAMGCLLFGNRPSAVPTTLSPDRWQASGGARGRLVTR